MSGVALCEVLQVRLHRHLSQRVDKVDSTKVDKQLTPNVPLQHFGVVKFLVVNIGVVDVGVVIFLRRGVGRSALRGTPGPPSPSSATAGAGVILFGLTTLLTTLVLSTLVSSTLRLSTLVLSTLMVSFPFWCQRRGSVSTCQPLHTLSGLSVLIISREADTV